MVEKKQLESGSDDCEFRISRVIDAPRHFVFEAWTNPAHFIRWWGPRGFANPVCELDLQSGGEYRIVMRAPDGVEYPIKGQFLDVVQSERLVMTLNLSGHPPEWHDLIKPNRERGDDNPIGQLLQTVTFEDVDGKTNLTIQTRFESAAICDAMLKMGMYEGWEESLDRLQSEVVRIANPALDQISQATATTVSDHSLIVKVSRQFSASAENVFDAWLNPAGVGMWLFATPGGVMVEIEIDARVGGEFTVIEKRGDVMAEHFGRYLEINRPNRLAFAFTTDKAERPSRVSIVIEPAATGCELTLTHEIEAKWLDYVDRVHSGWSRMLKELSDCLATSA